MYLTGAERGLVFLLGWTCAHPPLSMRKCGLGVGGVFAARIQEVLLFCMTEGALQEERALKHIKASCAVNVEGAEPPGSTVAPPMHGGAPYMLWRQIGSGHTSK